MKLEVPVYRRHIMQGQQNNGRNCPVFLALKETVKREYQLPDECDETWRAKVNVSKYKILFWIKEDDRTYNITLSQRLAKWIAKYDSYGTTGVEPMKIIIDLDMYKASISKLPQEKWEKESE